ncbi:rRNA (cytosine-N4-)-methyltransferase [Aureococcus anophagefferens]|nr:rRNA (cytosine-N4-)-methyltransferase [Aureococcus anophagefferens]
MVLRHSLTLGLLRGGFLRAPHCRRRLALRAGEGAAPEALPAASAYHTPVMGNECVDWLVTKRDGFYAAGDRLAADGRFSSVHANYDAGVRRAVEAAGRKADGVLLDLGVSSRQLDDAARGFSFRGDGPIDMRMDGRDGTTASDLVNGLDERDLAFLLRANAGERRARSAQKKAVARAFQALRVEVNDEFGALERLLLDLPSLVAERGRVVVLTYHSLEDRRVKRIFRDGRLRGDAPRDDYGNKLAPFAPLHRKALPPPEGEIERNPRARSAKLRAAERTEIDME